MIGELDGFRGELAGGLLFGDSRTTFVGVAFILNERCGESTTLVGDSVMGGILTGESIGAEIFVGDKVIMGSFRGEPSPGIKEKRLLRRRVDRLLICFSSNLNLTSAPSGEAGTSNSIKGCMSATMRVVFSVFGSIGQRELCRFLGTHFKPSSGNGAGLVLLLSPVVGAGAVETFFDMETEASCPSLASRKQYLLINPLPRASIRSHFPSRRCSTLGCHLASPQTGICFSCRTRFLAPWPSRASSAMARE
jgi:hypothetical protein